MKRLALCGLASLGLLAAWLVGREPPQATLAASPEAAVPQPAAPPPRDAPASASQPKVAPTPTVQPAAAGSAPSIGAEGYGPHIDRAQAGRDPKAAWEAVQWLRQCATNEDRRSSFEVARNQGYSPQMMTQLMVEADAEARRCQTVTAAHRALLPELASRAMRAGLPEAASAYAGAVFPGDLTPSQRQEVAQAMRRDAQTGDVPSLLGALTSHEAWGLTDEERLTYLATYAALGGQPGQAMAKGLVDSGQIRFRTTPTPEQLQAALRSAQP